MHLSTSAIALTTTALVIVAAATPTIHTNPRATTNTPQWIVVGVNGELLDVDPEPFKPVNRLVQKRREQQEMLHAAHLRTPLKQETTTRIKTEDIHTSTQPVSSDCGFFDDDEDGEDGGVRGGDESTGQRTEELFAWRDTHIPDIETLESDSDHVTWLHELELEVSDSTEQLHPRMSFNTSASAAPMSFLSEWARLLEDDSAFPTVQSSILFAELSCLFVLFIGYLVLSIPLWPSFSRGQKCCLLLAFGAACIYQCVALGWYFGGLSPETTLSISSLITRTISLGMVPITTTSFIGRARQIPTKHSENEDPQPVAAPVYPPSRHRRAKAKAAANAAASPGVAAELA